MKWYHAYDEAAERWYEGGDSKEAAIEEGRGWYDPSETFAVAPEDLRTREDFVSAVTHAITHNFDYADECLSEDGWIDPEEGFLEGNREIEQMIREFVCERIARPDWRTIATQNAEIIHPEEDD